MKKLNLILIGILFIGLFNVFGVSENAASPSYYRVLTITNNSVSTEYNVTVPIDLSGSNMTWANTTTDGHDVRIRDSSGNYPYFWIAKWDQPGTSGRVYLKVPTISASTTLTYYFIYGDTDYIPEYQDGNNTFLFFDDFDGIEIDSSKWPTVSIDPAFTYSVADSKLYVSNLPNAATSSSWGPPMTFTGVNLPSTPTYWFIDSYSTINYVSNALGIAHFALLDGTDIATSYIYFMNDGGSGSAPYWAIESKNVIYSGSYGWLPPSYLTFYRNNAARNTYKEYASQGASTLTTTGGYKVRITTYKYGTTYPVQPWKLDWVVVGNSGYSMTSTLGGVEYNYNAPPSVPILVSPSNWSTSNSLTPAFDWEDSSDLEGDDIKYEIWYSTDSIFGFYVNASDINVSTYTPSNALFSNVQVYWKARSIDCNTGIVSDWSEVWTLQTNAFTGGSGTSSPSTAPQASCAYDLSNDKLTCNAWFLEDGNQKTGISNVSIVMSDSTGATIHTFNSGSVGSDGIYREVWISPGSLSGSYPLRVSMDYDGYTYTGVSTFDAGFMEVQDALASMQTTLNTINSNTDTLETSLLTIDSKLDDINSYVDTLELIVNATRLDVSSINSSVGNMELQMSLLEDQIEIIDDNVNSSVEAIDSIQTYIGSPADDKSLPTLYGYGNYLKDKWGSSNADTIYLAIDTIDGKADTLSSSVGSIESDVSNIVAQYNSIESTLNDIETDVGSLDISVLNAQLSSISNSLNSIQSSLGNLNVNVDLTSIQNDLNEIKGEVSMVKKNSETAINQNKVIIQSQENSPINTISEGSTGIIGAIKDIFLDFGNIINDLMNSIIGTGEESSLSERNR